MIRNECNKPISLVARALRLVVLLVLLTTVACASPGSTHDGELLAVHESNPWNGILEVFSSEQLASVPDDVHRLAVFRHGGDDVVPTLMGMEHLHTLYIGACDSNWSHREPPVRFSDENLRELSRHPSLRYLALERVEMTETGLLALAELTNLRCLNMLDCLGVTPEAAEKFRRLRPDVRFDLAGSLPEEEPSEE